jgi:MFS family permease
VTTNSVIATEYNVSYMMAAALTGIPFIFAAFSGLCASVLGKVVGKRALMVGGGVLMLVGAVWNMHVMNSYGQFMGSRVFQGVGWGVFEGLVGECVEEVFFVSLPFPFPFLGETRANRSRLMSYR